MRRRFCCDASKALYEDYYVAQSGSGMPYFQGARSQRGHGIGSFLSGLFRSAWPLIKSGAKVLGKQALRTGLQIANDVVDRGESIQESGRRRIPEAIKSVISGQNVSSQSGSGRKRRRLVKLIKRKKRSKRDIFDTL